MVNPVTPKEKVIEGVATLTDAFLKRRLIKLTGNIGQFLNVNPFLVSALRDFHSFNKLSDLAEFMFIGHMASGHSTGFGKLVDEKILPEVFGTLKLTARVRAEKLMTAAAFNEIDHVVNPQSPDQWSLLSLKAGPWTIQDSTAHSLYEAFKGIGDFQRFGKEIVVGVFYGNTGSLTNKYGILRGVNPRQQDQFVVLNHVRVLAGREFWAWLNGGVAETQEWVLEGTRLGASMLLNQNAEHRDIIKNAPRRLAEEIAKKYNLSVEQDIDWVKLLLAINDPPVEGGGAR
ncbi:hypothetical protein NB699_002062 [Xanthomonas sacchari]|uniref:Restriction endonuclease n=1 Tax=Xanthomonas sacchari TaxID=56458 RepID=A0AA46SU32_9XANT|nr:hypothetical protein [Xanthomonas sacchari]MCW0367079.1 hypothetical protein [Xanthomonas sacchari]MCW0441009.1 hypothetical protein [Xanthomonas sacchari]UYK88536.1 hypothetical protein NG824_19015 [Xanthomonas sacchari]